MDTALDQRQSFLMRQGHLNDLDDTPHEDCRDGDQPDAAYGRDPLHHKLDSATGFLVELTGIEPVASWLQTRRSPS